ncbi:mannose-1-phosphate guanylyltransferase/mannose-6-phosphate isomerase [Rhodoferax sp. AJA081-3]|uniref:mannose-1-phosphate guanylyltransferase/mannose-6-phosphate isomerase n=1 Tax=Rhodoferax sp. AJA081-3 TaxID=2752316 RepID=UPI001ADED206|nr:mannose-1-phosphate guanylyltransferase/mannose-6-phosphate isomerase [Rhodoferax sp. AJA081-3]QTN27728.1 mannose-1-phosphate guanylyltransferase/mannose-6-phosphate isomerase [Rhodoferax sp. AJA081-3]
MNSIEQITPNTIISVILCGGSGTRLWPLSRKALPKQFVPLLHGKSLLQLTMQRASLLGKSQIIVASEEHRFLVQDCADAAQVHGTILLEPVARNTAAAMAAAALNAPADALLLFLPADHHIPDAAAFAATIRSAVPAAQAGSIVTFGVQPSFPSTAYGYIQQGAALAGQGAAHMVQRFVEKPNATKAQELLLAGGYFWNAGIFLVRASTLLSALEQHAADILNACKQAVREQAVDGRFCRLGAEAFAACRSDSIDYAVMEKSGNVAVLPFAAAWSDVGSWNAVAELTAPDDKGNRVHGNGYAVDASDTFIHAPHRPVVALGTHNLLIIDTADAVLVADAGHAEQVKTVVAQLEAAGVPQALHHRHVARPWGMYDSVDSGERFQVKRIVVKPGSSLSLQMHHHRAEHWIVVSGTAEVTNGDKVMLLTENQSTYIPLGQVHRLSNPGKVPLEIIEVQSGSYLGEDDIVRLEDTYGRLVAPVKQG